MKTRFYTLEPRQSDGVIFWRGSFDGVVVCIGARTLKEARHVAADCIRDMRRRISHNHITPEA